MDRIKWALARLPHPWPSAVAKDCELMHIPFLHALCVSVVSKHFVPSYPSDSVFLRAKYRPAYYYFKSGFLKSLGVPLSTNGPHCMGWYWHSLCCLWELGLRNHHRKMSILLLLLLWIKKSFVSDAEVLLCSASIHVEVNLLTCKVE